MCHCREIPRYARDDVGSYRDFLKDIVLILEVRYPTGKIVTHKCLIESVSNRNAKVEEWLPWQKHIKPEEVVAHKSLLPAGLWHSDNSANKNVSFNLNSSLSLSS